MTAKTAVASDSALEGLAAQPRRAVAWTAALLAGLTVAKALGGLPWIGPVVLSLAAFSQLYLPMWQCERQNASYAAVGLTTARWRDDARAALGLCLAIFPLYALAVHAYLTWGAAAARAAGLLQLAAWVPQAVWAPSLPVGLAAWGLAAAQGIKLVATHLLGVALPEETFYRGYLQPQLETRWPPHRRWLGTAVGRGAVAAAALFALGHFLGEWNPGRLAPFFPALLFAWLRNRTQTVLGATLFHGLCNVFSELWWSCYG